MDPAWERAFERACKDQVALLTDNLAEGGANGFADYRFLCGQIRGIQFAMAELIRVRKSYNPDGDLDMVERV